MMTKKAMIAMMSMALMADPSILSSVVDTPTKGKAIKPTKKIIPKGMTEFKFSDGFKCYALNIHNAIKKYNKWCEVNDKTNEQ